MSVKKEQINVRLSGDELLELDRLRARLGETKSGALRKAVRYALAQLESEAVTS
jgi:ribbon-helix-helix CopG family protein